MRPRTWLGSWSLLCVGFLVGSAGWGGRSVVGEVDLRDNMPSSLSPADWAELRQYGCPSHAEMVRKIRETLRRATSNPNWCMIFYHIPKTAGTTLRSLWTNNRLKTVTYGYDFWKSQQVVDRRFLTSVRHATEYHNRFKVLQGHFGYGMKTLLREIAGYVRNDMNRRGKKSSAENYPPIGQHCFEGTMLREPVGRVVSAVYFHKQFKARNLSDPSAWRECLGEKNFTQMYLKGTNFQSDPQGLCFEYSNDHVKWLSGKFTMRLHRVMASGQTTFGTDGHATTEHLVMAKRNLCKMDFILMQSEMDDSIEALAKSLGLAAQIRNHTWDNRRGARKAKAEEITDDIKDVIVEYNNLDIELHKFAVKLYAARQIATREAGVL